MFGLMTDLLKKKTKHSSTLNLLDYHLIHIYVDILHRTDWFNPGIDDVLKNLRQYCLLLILIDISSCICT